MGSASIEQEMPAREGIRSRFENLRGVQWRIDLGILPSPSSSSVDDLRRVTAESRRRYAGLRRRLLVDPHLSKDGRNSPDPVIDNPLSQNPDSTWGRFFRNAELEKTLDQDLSRLYPEHGSYFQTPGCQGMLRRILLLWCLRHPEYGYRQGMHELLAPFLYVLHVDVEHLSEVRKQYEDHFTDKFDGLGFQENDLTYNFDFKKLLDSMEDEIGSHGNAVKVKSLNELDPEIQTTVLLTDAYGAEGELGIVISEKFMEHDAYCMFDALMSGSHGSVAVVDFYSHSPAHGSHSGLPPVIETSAALYHLLSVVDSSLHSHLVELGVEPQYFALRWLRVLFGREFSLENLLLIWDEIFAADNNVTSEKGAEDDADSGFRIFRSPRGALIPAMSVSMILHLRSSLLATEHATTCLQRLLNFPENIDLRKLIDKAKSLQALALDTNMSSVSPPFDGIYNHSVVKGSGKKVQKSFIRRSLLEDLSHELGVDEDIGKSDCHEVSGKDHQTVEVEEGGPDSVNNGFTCSTEERCLSGNAGSEENSSVFSDPSSSLSGGNDHENDSEKSSVASNMSVDENDQPVALQEDPTLPVSHPPEGVSLNSGTNNEPAGKQVAGPKERKLSGKFQWLWKFGWNTAGEETSEKGSNTFEATKPGNDASNQINSAGSSSVNGSCNSYASSKGDSADQNVMGTLRNFGQSMLEHIQVIESVFQQERGQVGSLENFSKTALVGKGQVTAMTALTELRKISNLLSEM
ncbi:hypothetical protein OIU77_005564 [Salix suchowensis]|uniref:Rab-GAP TBC domain-containing protein n=1 Tax=Salix suchowensis TaxID=1278906 RepID=A0ABQ9AQZ7_9ROSI|nr:hypothetical protein OIU77_005564 [Salix suchowensis]